jgi:DNA-binding NarL/FixJ family response regulator
MHSLALLPVVTMISDVYGPKDTLENELTFTAVNRAKTHNKAYRPIRHNRTYLVLMDNSISRFIYSAFLFLPLILTDTGS